MRRHAVHEYFTYKFLTDHVELRGRSLDKGPAKKKAEVRYQIRSVPVNTLLCLWDKDLIRLAGEVRRRQQEYADNPGGLFVSEAAYAYFERRGKRAKEYSPRHFRYAVRREHPKGLYKIHHLDGMV